jgi:hypothetical protein
MAPDNRLMAVSVEANGPALSPSPTPLFQVRIRNHQPPDSLSASRQRPAVSGHYAAGEVSTRLPS